ASRTSRRARWFWSRRPTGPARRTSTTTASASEPIAAVDCRRPSCTMITRNGEAVPGEALQPTRSSGRATMGQSLTATGPERTIEFEFIRATENAALSVLPWLGRGEKEKADAAACDAINGVFDLVDLCGEVLIGEGLKDNAPGLFVGDRLGTWKPGSPRFD